VTAKTRYPLRGLVVSLNTPFDDDDGIDHASLEKLIEVHLTEGAVGFLVAAQAGEVHRLTVEERLELLRTVRAQTNGRAIVIAGATAREREVTLRVAREAVALGCDGVLAEPPPNAEPDAIREFFRTVAHVGVPMLMIQDVDWHGTGMPIPLIVELFDEIDVFRSLKIEVVTAGPKYSEVLAATGGRLHVSGGWAALQMIEALDRGVDVFMNTALTRWYRRILDAHGSGQRARAVDCFHKILPVLSFTRQHLDVSIHFHKRLFVHRGIFRTARCRTRAMAYDAYHERCGLELMAYLDRLDSATTQQ